MLRQRRHKTPSSSNRKARNQRGRVATTSPVSFASFFDFLGFRPIKSSPVIPPQSRRFVASELAVATFIFVLTAVTRFFRLDFPSKIVFDEFHFAAFVDQYIRGEYLFDIHPPLGKLTLTAVAKLAGYQSQQNFTFASLGQSYGPVMYIPQRAFSAFMGCFIPPVIYLTARATSLSFWPSVATAAMPLFDILLCIESRLILTDSQLILYIQLAYLFAFLLWQTPRSTPRRYILLCLTALAGAAAISTKWTAFVAPAVIGIVSLTGLIFPHARLDPVEMVIAAIIAAAVYVSCFWVHFNLLPKSGKGDAFMPIPFRRTLIGNEHYDPNAKPLSFLSNFRYLNWEMLRANSAIKTRHHWESKWYQWLYNARGVLYLDEHLPENKRERIYLIMNPFLPVVTAVGVIASLVFIIFVALRALRAYYKPSPEITAPSTKSRGKGKSKTAYRKKNDDADDGELGDDESDFFDLELSPIDKQKAEDQMHASLLTVLFGAWATNLLPYIGVQRCTFLYHVLPSLQVASIMTGIMLHKLPARYGVRAFVSVSIILMLIAAFWWWRAWTYGLHRTVKELEALRWMKGWN